LAELKAIRDALVVESQSAPVATVQGGDDARDKKIEELQNENRRLNYRITHLARNLQAALQK
jgi:chaperonin cofactor prefoldin